MNQREPGRYSPSLIRRLDGRRLVRGGVAAWVQAAPLPAAIALPESHQTPVGLSPLLTLVAAMIAGVSQ